MRHRASLLLILFLIFSCGGKREAKYVSPESKTSQEAFALAETLRSAFVKKDLPAIEKNTSPEGYRHVIGSRRSFDTIDLTFTPRWVDIEQNKVLLNISWKATWVISGKQKEDRGMAVFQMEGSPLRLTQIQRSNPFAAPEQ